MIAIVVTERGGASRRIEFTGDEVTIGRIEDNDVVLPKPNVSKHHAKLVLRAGGYELTDLGSTNGTYLNGRKIDGPRVVASGDEIYLGDFALALAIEPERAAAEPAVHAEPPPVRVAPAGRRTSPGHGTPSQQGGSDDTAPISFDQGLDHGLDVVRDPVPSPSAGRHGASGAAPQAASAASLPAPETSTEPTPSGTGTLERVFEALPAVMRRLAAEVDVFAPVEAALGAEPRRRLERIVDEVVQGSDADRRLVADAAEREAVGLGAIDGLLDAPEVREIIVEGPSRILVDRGEGLVELPARFSSVGATLAVARRLLARAGVTEHEGVVEARLFSGARAHVMLPPVARDGPFIGIRRVPRGGVQADALVRAGFLSQDMLELLTAAVRARVNVLVSGPARGGVSTLLSLLASRAADAERIVTIERTPSLAFTHRGRLALDRTAALPLGTLFDAASRLRPGLVVVDDLAGEDALAFLEHASVTRGVVAGMHAPSAGSALEHLEAFAALALGGAQTSLAPLVAHALDLIVHVEPTGENVRRATSIAELRGARDAALQARELYRFDGTFRASGERAQFLRG